VHGLDADPVAAARAAGVSLRNGEGAALAAAARFRRQRHALQEEQVARLAEQLPLPQIPLPYLFSSDLGRDAVETLADAAVDGIRGLPAVPGDRA
jgi:hypothetical protein